ncbi:serine/threonine protein kinase [Chloroflexi bacterium TSY]|nr:serine/threonine protein kinase [Chloroflexi bacterium TSY]
MQTILEPGTTLRDRYEISELVGQGGGGAVYKATDQRLEGRICAIKENVPLINAQTSDELEKMAEQFRAEASILARLDHPNLPKVSDYFSIDGREYLVMDYVSGRDLQEIIRQAQRRGEKLKESEVLGWAMQLLDAIEYLHSQDPPVLHKDIKPANIKVTPHGIIKLVDFGLVKFLQDDDSRTVTVIQGRGTAAYTPLEQYGSGTGFTDTRSDIYSFAATLYHLLAGDPPIDAKERFLHPGSLVSLRQINPSISPRVERSIFQGLSMHPNERPSSARSMRDLLVGSKMPLPPATVTIENPTKGWLTIIKENLVLVGAAAALLVIATILSVFPPQFTVP